MHVTPLSTYFGTLGSQALCRKRSMLNQVILSCADFGLHSMWISPELPGNPSLTAIMKGFSSPGRALSATIPNERSSTT